MTSIFLQAMRPFMRITPEVVKPTREVRFNEKVLWTFGALIVYFIMTVVPVFNLDGPISTTQADPFQFLRTIMASTRGTLAELGIGPIVTAGLIMQILVGSKLIQVDMGDPEERALYTGAQKVLSVIMTIFEAGAYILGGAYGNNLSGGAMALIMLQLLSSGIAIILLDEMIQKGWGLGSGISLFIAGGVATQIFYHSFAFANFADGLVELPGLTQLLPIGAITALLTAISEGGFFQGITMMFFRVDHPTNSLVAIIATIVVFLVVIYFECMKIDIPVSYSDHRGFRGKYPIKLMYVSNIPVILVSAVFADIYFIAQMFSNVAPDFLLTKWLGEFDPQSRQPTGGLVLYLTPPRGLYGRGAVFPIGSTGGLDFGQLINNLPRAFVYGFLMIVLSVAFSKMWITTAGMASKDVAKQLLDAGMQIPGWRRSEKTIERRLEMYIPAAAALGGFLIGVLAAFADFAGALGTGTGILLSVSIMRQYFDILVKERAAEMHPALRGFLGIL
ncbi:MAG: preprotein translocase subunit SecY [Candidatus Thorarchaeota archaeon]